jgi:hypothetical protein
MAAVFRQSNNPRGRAAGSSLRRAKNAAVKAASPSPIDKPIIDQITDWTLVIRANPQEHG